MYSGRIETALVTASWTRALMATYLLTDDQIDGHTVHNAVRQLLRLSGMSLTVVRTVVRTAENHDSDGPWCNTKKSKRAARTR